MSLSKRPHNTINEYSLRFSYLMEAFGYPEYTAIKRSGNEESIRKQLTQGGAIASYTTALPVAFKHSTPRFSRCKFFQRSAHFAKPN